MESIKDGILSNLCYTELVYERINRKLVCRLSRREIEEMIFAVLKDSEEKDFSRRGKNIYVTSHGKNIRITINSNTFRVITVDRVFVSWRQP